MKMVFRLCQRQIAMCCLVMFAMLFVVKADDSRYLVIDLSGGVDVESYPVTYLSDVPAGGWTDEYKTTKLVLRKIPEGTFIMGYRTTDIPGVGNDWLHEVTISNPFYIGIFEVTQKQYELVTGKTPSSYSGDARPVADVSWDDIRGDSTIYNWPHSSEVSLSAFIGRLRDKTGILTLDLPTEAKWEYACRAGTTTALNSGKNLSSSEQDENMNDVGRYKYNTNDGKGGFAQHTTVGSYLPNAWGLYDMHGNVWEWCLDWWSETNSFNGNEVDPTGPQSGTHRVRRGGSLWNSAESCRSASRWHDAATSRNAGVGFRLSCSVEVFDIVKVYFDACGGVTDELFRSYAVSSRYGDLPIVSKDGYLFDGWYTAVTGGVLVTESAHTIASVTTLYARWIKYPKYLVIDLSGGVDATAYPVTYLEDVPSGGWTDEYKTEKLVMRRIRPGSIPTRDAKITKPYYIGVFEVTQRQYELVKGTRPSHYKNPLYYATRPVEKVSYNTIRGSSLGSDWPSSSAVDSTSFMGRIRERTNIDTFDLPTEAQWEYACRAGTTTHYNSGKNYANSNADPAMDEVGRYNQNGGSDSDQNCDTSKGTAKVGCFIPNAWGLYDMHGNVSEWCLDWYGGSLVGNDPVGADSGSYRILRGGSLAHNASDCTSAKRKRISPSVSDNIRGFRLTCAATKKEFVVAFDANGGIGAMIGQPVLEGDDLVIAENAFIREGYMFSGWSTSPRGDVEFDDCDTIETISDDIMLYAIWEPYAPVSVPADEVVFANAMQTVSLSCLAKDARILFTTDGSDPLANGREYSRPFDVYNSCTVRAVAIGEGVLNSDEMSLIITRGDSLSEAANLYGYLMETDSLRPWTVATDVSYDGASSVRSGSVGNNETTYLQTSVKKAGTVSFWWQSACEDPDEEEGDNGYYDYGAFSIDGVIVARIAGHDGEWHYVSHEVTGGGKHVLKWEYSKDGIGSYSPDCIWVDQAQWIPADDSGYTLTTPEHVPYSWLKKYGFDGKEMDFETVAGAFSGKTQGGKATRLWEEFVAGTDPTNATSVVTAKIEMQDGEPVVTWEPNLNTNGVERLYKIHGKETLSNDEEWAYPTNSLHRFFKVTVEMP